MVIFWRHPKSFFWGKPGDKKIVLDIIESQKWHLHSKSKAAICIQRSAAKKAAANATAAAKAAAKARQQGKQHKVFFSTRTMEEKRQSQVTLAWPQRMPSRSMCESGVSPSALRALGKPI